MIYYNIFKKIDAQDKNNPKMQKKYKEMSFSHPAF